MLKKVLSYSAIGMLALTLIAGTAYIVLNPTAAQAESGPVGGRGRVVTESAPGSAAAGNLADCDETGGGGPPWGTEAITPSVNGGGRGQAVGSINGTGAGGGVGTGYGNSAEPIDAAAWQTITGIVTLADSELTVATDEGELLIGMGQSWYREEAGFVVNVGDEVRVTGFYEDGEFKAAHVENLSTTQQIALRDTTGRPMWAGRGRGGN
jgi:hypothetical protein